jgi:hypothetical protein
MKTKMKKRVIIALAVLLPLAGIISLTAFTYTNIEKKKAEIFTEMKTYVEENILPVLKPLRAELESELTAEEKATIDELRDIASDLIDKSANRRQNCRFREKRPFKELTPDEKEQVKQAQKQIRSILTGAWEIMDNHEETFDDIRSELAPKHKQWHDEMHEIVKNHVPKALMKKIHEHREGFRSGHHPGHDRHHHIMKGLFAPVIFILWDTETNFPLNKVAEQIEVQLYMGPEIEEGSETEIAWSLYPNPAINSCNIQFTLSRGGEVTINLINKNTNQRERIAQENYNSGTYTKTIDLSGKAHDVYFVEIVTPSGIFSKKLVVE